MANASLAIAQEAWGTITFQNLNIATADGTRTYNVPIYQDPAFTSGRLTGVGLLPDGVTAGLFRPQDLSTPLATSVFGPRPNSLLISRCRSARRSRFQECFRAKRLL
jgi:hypothetical protein